MLARNTVFVVYSEIFSGISSSHPRGIEISDCTLIRNPEEVAAPRLLDSRRKDATQRKPLRFGGVGPRLSGGNCILRLYPAVQYWNVRVNFKMVLVFLHRSS